MAKCECFSDQSLADADALLIIEDSIQEVLPKSVQFKNIGDLKNVAFCQVSSVGAKFQVQERLKGQNIKFWPCC